MLYLFDMAMHYHTYRSARRVTNPEWQFLTDYRESWALKDRSLNDNREVPSSNGSGRRPVQFPELPILNASAVVSTSAPVRSQREKYGGLFYLGISGLVFLIAWIGWFGYGVWTNRDIWADVYTLSSTTRPEEERVQAAFRLSGNPRLDDTQKMALTLRRDLPDLARYLLAESVSTELVARDPRSFTMLVARSPGWPDWIRLILSRRLGYAAGRGYDIPREPIEELRQHSDPMIRLWATYTLALLPRSGSDPAMIAEMEEAAHAADARSELATRLLGAIPATREWESRLDEATIWLRHHHSQAAKIWRGWEVRDQQIVQEGVR